MSLIKNKFEIAKIELAPVTSLNNVYVDSHANVYRKRKSGLMQLTSHDNGRNYMIIIIDGQCHLIHRLVLEAFVGKCPRNFNADHIDHNTQNNNISNLRWIHKSKNFAMKKSSRDVYDKVGDKKEMIINLLSRNIPAPQIEKITGVKRSNVYNIKYTNFL